MVKQKIAKASVIAILILSTLMFLPWMYMTPVYYITRYVIMAMTVVTLVLTFSLNRCLSVRFVRMMLYTIICMSVLLLFVPIRKQDITQLIVAFMIIIIGMGIEWSDKDWAEVGYYYAILMIAVTICNCFFYAGGLYVPEHYMFDEGKNQVGAMVAIGATSCFYFGIKFKEERTAYWVISFLALLCIVLIRARADVFALIAVMLLITVKESELHLSFSLKTLITIVSILLIGVIIYTGFISDELHTFMVGGKNAQNLNDVTSDRWARNQEGLEMLSHSDSDSDLTSKTPYIHNYPLLRLVRYGFFSIPLLAFYVYFGICAIIEVFKTRKSNTKQAGWIVCCVPLLISLAEPSFPYGPGLVQMLAFLLLGFSLRPEDTSQYNIPKIYTKMFDTGKALIIRKKHE